MSKTLKNIITAFSALCMIVLVVFCVELFLLNRDGASGRDSSSLSGDTADPSDSEGINNSILIFDDLPGSQAQAPPGSPEENDEPAAGPAVAPSLEAQRQRFLLAAGIAELVFYVDMELFERSEETGSIFYRHLPDRDSWIELSFAAINPQDGVSVLAEGFLGSEQIIEGERSIGRSPIRGTFMTIEMAGETYSAWLRSLADFNTERLALVVVIKYQNIMESDLIFSILDTMYINMLTETPPDDDEDNSDD